MPFINPVENDFQHDNLTSGDVSNTLVVKADAAEDDSSSQHHQSSSSNDENNTPIDRPTYYVKVRKLTPQLQDGTTVVNSLSPLQDRTNTHHINTQRSNILFSLPPLLLQDRTNNFNSQRSPKSPYYKKVYRERETSYKVQESKSTAGWMVLQYDDKSTSNPYPFTCDAKCTQHVSYKLLSNMKYKPFDLAKLDITLNTESVLLVQIDCTLNEQDCLEYPSWIIRPLNKVMEKSKFKNLGFCPIQGSFRFVVQKAFVSTPLSYLLEKEAPHGVLEKLYINLDFTTNHSKEFRAAWKQTRGGFSEESLSTYIEDTLLKLITRRVHCNYPFIFSSNTVKELTPVFALLPEMSKSLLSVIKIAKAASPNPEFNERMAEKLMLIGKNTKIMAPLSGSSEEDKDLFSLLIRKERDTEGDKNLAISTDLTSGLYSAAKKGKVPRKSPESTTLASFALPPNALEAIGNIWSVTNLADMPPSTEDQPSDDDEEGDE